MHYTDHAKISARKFGGKPEDYCYLHRLIDSSKHHFPHFMHRLFSHNTWFISVIDDLIGPTITNSNGSPVSVRDVLHEHLREDHDGKCPTIQDWMENIEVKAKPNSWINSPSRKEIHWLKSQNTNEKTENSKNEN